MYSTVYVCLEYEYVADISELSNVAQRPTRVPVTRTIAHLAHLRRPTHRDNIHGHLHEQLIPSAGFLICRLSIEHPIDVMPPSSSSSAAAAAASPVKPTESDEYRGRPSTIAIIFIVLVVLIAIAVVAAIIIRQLRARRLGIPTSYNPFGRSSSAGNYPSNPSGPLGWLKDRLNGLRNRRHRTAEGVYEEPLGNAGVDGRYSHRGFDPLDPDEAWDSRVGAEADGDGPGGYYEEQELGLHRGTAESYGGGEYDEVYGHGSSSTGPVTTSRASDQQYDQEMGRSRQEDPFGETAEHSEMPLRRLSPTPADVEPRQPQAPAEEHADPDKTLRRDEA